MASDLFSIITEPEVGTESIPACAPKDVLSCIVIDIDFAALDEALAGNSISLMEGLELSNAISPSNNSVTVSDDVGNTATFTWAQRGTHTKLVGNIQLADGRDFTLEPCREFHGCHVLIEESEENWGEGEESRAILPTEEHMKYAVLNRRLADPAKVQQGKDDSTTIVTFSVKFYYTYEFAAATEDIPLYFEQVIAETNQGYINSDIPVRIMLHCIEAADLHDIGDGGDMIDAFSAYKPTEELLDTADAAALIVQEFSYCGIGYLGSFMYGNTITVSMKSCALGYYTFGHELGHNFGCMHDAVQGPNSLYPYGLGKHLEGTGSRTNMAYRAPGFNRKVNYYSNPNVSYQGVVTGTEEENNARVIREHRFAFAAIGDESSTCGSPTNATTQAPTVGPSQTNATTQAPPATSGQIISSRFPSKYQNNIDSNETIEVAAGNKILINFTDFNIESHYACSYDYITIVDNDGTTLMNKTCGNNIPPAVLSSTNKVNVIFHSDYSVRRTGWKLTWAIVLPLTGSITSPNYPSEYSNDLDTVETIEVDVGKQIKISVVDFHLEMGTNCRYDWVKIMDANGDTILDKSCGTSVTGDFYSSTNKVNVTFHSDYSMTAPGYKFEWTEVDGAAPAGR